MNEKRVPVEDDVWVHKTPAYTFAFVLNGDEELAPTGIEFSLVNHSESVIKILWDDSTIIFPSGASSRVFHLGVKYSEANSSQPPCYQDKKSKPVQDTYLGVIRGLNELSRPV